MKNRSIILYLLVLCLCQAVYSQNYQANYLEFGKLNRGNAVLTFNSTSWQYKMLYKLNDNITSDDFYIPEKEAHSDFDIKLFNYYSLENKEFLWELIASTEKVVVKDTLYKIDWVIHNDSIDIIGGYNCIMAECDLCGWSIKAWFTPEIPVSCGPWRLWGLPGLILKAYSYNGDIDIQLTSFKKIDASPIEPNLSKRKVISKSEFVSLSNENAQKLSRILNNSQGREASINIGVKIKNQDKCF